MTRLFVSPKRRPRNATLQLEMLEKIIAPSTGLVRPHIDVTVTFKSQNDVSQSVDQSQKSSPYVEVHQTSSADGFGGTAYGGDAKATSGDATAKSKQYSGDATAKAEQYTGDTGKAKAKADAQTGDTGDAKASSKKGDPKADSGDSGDATAKAYSGDSGDNKAKVTAYSGDNKAKVTAYSGDATATGGDAYANGTGGYSNNDSSVKIDTHFGSPSVSSTIKTDQQLKL
jgi:hypothetical protein